VAALGVQLEPRPCDPVRDGARRLRRHDAVAAAVIDPRWSATYDVGSRVARSSSTNRSGDTGAAVTRAAIESAAAWTDPAGRTMTARWAYSSPQRSASASSIHRRSASAIAGGVSAATDARTMRSTSSGRSAASQSAMRPPPDSASIDAGRPSPSRAPATAAAIARGWARSATSSRRAAIGRPTTTTVRALRRRRHRCARIDSVPANSRSAPSTPPSTSSGVAGPPGSVRTSIRPPRTGMAWARGRVDIGACCHARGVPASIGR
jgi:hypothetical protein